MEIDISDLYVERLLVFLETAPQSNMYRQVVLTPEQFKKVSDAVVTVVEERNAEGMESVMINMSEQTYPLPDLKDFE